MLMVNRGLETIQRPFTPIHVDNTGRMELIIKVYPDGKLTNILEKSRIGAMMKCRGPIREPMMEQFAEHSVDEFLFLCSGTGITPCLLMIDHLFSKKMIKGKMIVLASYQTDQDIIQDPRLLNLEKYNGKLKVIYTVGRAKPEWTGLTGRINTQIISQTIVKTGMEGFLPNSLSSKEVSEPLAKFITSEKTIRFGICGSTKFCTQTKDSLRQLFVPTECIVIF
jgi:cytochrome-b5 reductase